MGVSEERERGVCVCVCVRERERERERDRERSLQITALYYYRMTKELGLIKFYVSHHTKREYYKAGERLQRLQYRVTVHTVI